MKDNYDVDYRCGNCGWHGTLDFPRGTPAPEYEVCPNCGCRRAHKAWPVLPPAHIDKGFPSMRDPWEVAAQESAHCVFREGVDGADPA